MVDGADVISGQQVIGRVTDVALRDGRPELTLSLDKTADLPQNVTATVEIPSALGTPFLRLQSPPSPQGRLQAGATIPAGSDVGRPAGGGHPSPPWATSCRAAA